MNSYWTLHLYTYEADIVIDDVPCPIRPGYATVLPPGTRSVYRFPHRSIHACSHFTFPERGADAPVVAIPMIQDLGARFGETYEALEGAIACFRSNPLQAEVRLWDILWRLTARTRESGELIRHEHHPAVRKARELIEVNLASLMPVSEIADAVDLSHNQLTRLFRAAFDTTVIGYIQQQRAMRARHLLEHTQLPIKTIAAQVGMDDSRLFNKLIHDTLGGSPTEIRNQQSNTGS